MCTTLVDISLLTFMECVQSPCPRCGLRAARKKKKKKKKKEKAFKSDLSLAYLPIPTWTHPCFQHLYGLSWTHTHTHTHTHTQPRSLARSLARTHTHTHRRTHARTHARTLARTHPHTHTLSHMHIKHIHRGMHAHPPPRPSRQPAPRQPTPHAPDCGSTWLCCTRSSSRERRAAKASRSSRSPRLEHRTGSNEA